MNIKVKYNQLIVETEIKVAEFERARGFDPKVVAVVDENNRILFAVNMGVRPEMSHNRVAFNQVLNGKLAIVKELTNTDAIKKSEVLSYVEQAYGAGLAALAKHEATIIKQVADTLAPIQETLDNIEV